MAYFNEKETIVGWETFRGSDNRDYLKSAAMDELMEKSPCIAYICKSTGRRKIFFDAITAHAEEGKGLRAKGLLQALGDLYEKKRLAKGETDKIIREFFRGGINDVTKREFVYREPVKAEEISVKDNASAESEEAEEGESERSESLKPKNDKNVWDYIPF